MMDWTTQTEILKRIVALLLALADLADRASLASRPVRCHVLGILRQAEIVAQVAEPARDCGAPLPICRPNGASIAVLDDDPDAAARLALRLRALSLAWAALLAWMLRIAVRLARPPRPPSTGAAAAPARALAAALPPDTS